MTLFEEIKTQFNLYTIEQRKLFEQNISASAPRARKALQALQKLCREERKNVRCRQTNIITERQAKRSGN